MAAPVPWVLPSPFVAQVLRKAAIHDSEDFFRAKQVCRSWRDAADGDEFYQDLLEACVDVTEVYDTGCFIETYKSGGNWCRYVDRGDGLPEDDDDHYVFRPLLVGTKAGFLTIPNADLLRGGCPQLTFNSIMSVMSLGKELMRIEARTAMGNEGESYLTPIIFPMDPGKSLSPETALAALGANPFLLLERGLYRLDFSKRRHYLHLGVRYGGDEPGDLDSGKGSGLEEGGPVCRRFKKFMFEKGEPLIFYAGSMVLNPLPMFYLRKLTDRLVGGFIASLIHT
ncbi:hypothetical protein BSKO_03929 [Bryopsis sp. KO-2023]|nr:hypothetical protein BSKO_03929 [Bryopsis sp. KO-2023]